MDIWHDRHHEPDARMVEIGVDSTVGASELKRAQEIAEEEVQLLKEKWHEFFD